MFTSVSKIKCVVGSEYAKELVDLIDNAKHEIRVLMYDWRWYADDFSCDVSLINSALVRASRRGVDIKAITNYFHVVAQLEAIGIKAKSWNPSQLMHTKAIIIDKEWVISGSHNLTNNAMKNNIETSFIFNSDNSAGKLLSFFDQLWSLC